MPNETVLGDRLLLYRVVNVIACHGFIGRRFTGFLGLGGNSLSW